MIEIREELYLSPAYPDREALEKAVEFWDATQSQWVADCARRAEYAIRYGIEPKEEGYARLAGIALHAALASWYVTRDLDCCLVEIQKVWGESPDWRLPPGHKFDHLHLGFLETIFKNYVDFSRKHDTFIPLLVDMQDLDLMNVLGAIWNIAADGRVILGESKVVMRFDLTLPANRETGKVEHTEFHYAGRPDLPILMGGAVYLLDHKSTNSFLSDWYFSQYKFSNQLRGYGAMIRELLHKMPIGALINGLYMGEKAVLTGFGGTRFARYGPMLFQPEHLDEALVNQYFYRKQLDWHERQGYYPQHSSKLCQSCDYDPLCAATPVIRPAVMKQDYREKHRKFLDL